MIRLQLGGRRPTHVLRALVTGRHYRALLAAFRTYADPLECLRRYVFGTGTYPYVCRLRTPVGLVSLTLYGKHDMRTVNEIFCRGDYECAQQLRFVVDVGSNIGISGAYFLSRNSEVRCHLIEPDPRNVARLRGNLSPFEGRWTVGEHAVADFEGEADFGVEDSGRYGFIGRNSATTIRVHVVDANSVIEAVLEHVAHIDLLKIDIEGLEERVVASLRPELVFRVGSIVFEGHTGVELHPRRFAQCVRGPCTHLVPR